MKGVRLSCLVPAKRDDGCLPSRRRAGRLHPADRLTARHVAVLVVGRGGGGEVDLAAAAAAGADPVLGVAEVVQNLVLGRALEDGPENVESSLRLGLIVKMPWCSLNDVGRVWYMGGEKV